MKKRISLFMAAIMVLMVMLSAIPIAAATNTFNASDANPTISTAEDYIAFFKAVYGSASKLDFEGKTITMLNDITLNDTTVADWYTKSDAVKLVGNDSWKHFKGTFDGGNHTLKGVIVEGTFRSDAPIGIFPYVTFGGAVVNLTVDGFYVNSPNTSSDPTYGNAGIGGLIGHAKANVTVDNVTMKNGIVTCVANGKGGLGAVVGAYDGQEANQQLKITNTTVENTVKVIGGNDNVYVGGIIGYVHENYKSQPTTVDLSGSEFTPYGSVDGTLKPIGSFKAGGDPTPMFSWTLKNTSTGYEQMFEMAGGTDYTADWNAAIVASGCYAPVVRFVGMQTRASDNGARFIGLIKAVDLEQISSLGFEITVGGKTVGPDVIKCTKVYASMVEDGTPLAAPEGYYYFTFVITGVADNTSFDVKACATVNGTNYVTAVGTCVYPPVEA